RGTSRQGQRAHGLPSAYRAQGASQRTSDTRGWAGDALYRYHRGDEQRNHAQRTGTGAEIPAVAAGRGQPVPGGRDDQRRWQSGVVESPLPGTLRPGADRGAPPLRGGHGRQRTQVADTRYARYRWPATDRVGAASVRWT